MRRSDLRAGRPVRRGAVPANRGFPRGPRRARLARVVRGARRRGGFRAAPPGEQRLAVRGRERRGAAAAAARAERARDTVGRRRRADAAPPEADAGGLAPLLRRERRGRLRRVEGRGDRRAERRRRRPRAAHGGDPGRVRRPRRRAERLERPHLRVEARELRVDRAHGSRCERNAPQLAALTKALAAAQLDHS